jgi:hypothetical protein
MQKGGCAVCWRSLSAPKPPATAGVSDYGASEMSGPLPRLSEAGLSDGAAGDATGIDITQAAAAQWASFGSLDDNTSDIALETDQSAAAAVEAAAPEAAPEAEVLTPDDAQPSSAEALAPTEMVADATVNPASPAVGDLGRQQSGSPGDSRWATTHCLPHIQTLCVPIGMTALAPRVPLCATLHAHPALRLVPWCSCTQQWAEHGAGRGYPRAGPDDEHHRAAGRPVGGAGG